MDFTSFYVLAGVVVLIIVVVFCAMAIKIANQWERAVVLLLGRFVGIKGPGIFFIVPFLSRVAYWIDLRVITTSFNAEQTLTKDTVPVNVDAVLFWQVVDVEKAALEVKDYRDAISLASQTALRDVIGKTILSDMLTGREAIDAELQNMIGGRVRGWGIKILSVEIRDVIIPGALQDAMSMQAQAERERQARVILGDSERQIAEKFEQAAKSYENNPTALHLRAMNMLYEGLKAGKSTIVLVPASALETMNLGEMTGTIALAKTISKDQDPSDNRQQPEQP
ncbi:slipin family protein [Methanoregula sp.]|uniref:slipin family protein n=1 Tax=Methanoregula sp. TaxID=2052170 RepID=UPI002C2E299D|nr:slipin family protein [Methanoregula sp.]HVP95978.1 slipin family protein [Methanoregula sp.]